MRALGGPFEGSQACLEFLAGGCHRRNFFWRTKWTWRADVDKGILTMLLLLDAKGRREDSTVCLRRC